MIFLTSVYYNISQSYICRNQKNTFSFFGNTLCWLLANPSVFIIVSIFLFFGFNQLLLPSKPKKLTTGMGTFDIYTLQDSSNSQETTE